MTGKCPECGSDHLPTTRMQSETFEHGLAGPIKCQVLVTECGTCGFAWTGEQAEAARTEATISALSREVIRLRGPSEPEETPNLCPDCKSPDITGESIDIEGLEAVQECYCNECFTAWQDRYTLSKTTVIERDGDWVSDAILAINTND